MTLFLVFVFVAAALAVLATLAMGLVNLARTRDDDANGTGPSERALKSQKLMRQRVLIQGVAIGVLALILAIAAASKG
jgi:heme O synthase-like polyprenyltransferase